MRIEKDPDMTKLAQEARRLSMGTGVNTGNRRSPPNDYNTSNKRPSISNNNRTGIPVIRNGASGRRPSEGVTVGPHSPRLSDRRQSDQVNGGLYGGRRQSDSPSNRLFTSRRASELSSGGGSRRGSEARDHHHHDDHCEVHGDFPIHREVHHREVHRKPSAELDSGELERRRLSEAGLRRTSTSDAVLNGRSLQLDGGNAGVGGRQAPRQDRVPGRGALR